MRDIFDGTERNSRTFSGDELEKNIDDILGGKIHEVGGVVSCQSPQFESCPYDCRQLPMPTGAGCWGNKVNETACAKYPVQCKYVPSIDDVDIDQAKLALCAKPDETPDEVATSFCKTILPMKNNCNTGLIQYKSGRTTLSIDSDGSCNLPDKCYQCDINPDGSISCPSECNQLLSSCHINPNTVLKSVQGNCLDSKPSCRVVFREDFDNDPKARGTGITNCGYDLNRERWKGNDVAKDTAACPASLNPEESCVYILPKDGSLCTSCLFIEEDYQFAPPMLKTCQDLCSDTTAKSVSTGGFTQLAGEGYSGMTDVREASKFFIPAYLLPLLNLTVTIMFIKTFSTMLGGDIEIPGLSKVF